MKFAIAFALLVAVLVSSCEYVPSHYCIPTPCDSLRAPEHPVRLIVPDSLRDTTSVHAFGNGMLNATERYLTNQMLGLTP